MDGEHLTQSRARCEAEDVDDGTGQICVPESTQGKAKVMHSFLEIEFKDTIGNHQIEVVTLMYEEDLVLVRCGVSRRL